MKQSGIYKIQSKINPDKIYIGSAIDITPRWRLHLHDLKNNKHHSQKLQRHYNKYGKEDLLFIIIEPCLPMGLLAREQEYINKLCPCLNICKIAGNRLGIKASEEVKQRMRHPHKKFSEEIRQRMRRPLSESTKQKMRGRVPWNKGMTTSEACKLKMSIAKIGKPSPRKGTKASKETIEKLRRNCKPPSQLGRKRSKETIEKLRKARLNISLETKKRMREGQKKRHEFKKVA